MRIRLVVQRNGLPITRLIWTVESGDSSTISQLLEQINDIIPLESGEWGLEDYSVEVQGFECLHFQELTSVLKEDDEILIRPLQTIDLRSRKLSGRHQISNDGKHLIDGIAFGRPFLRKPLDRPEIRIPPRKRVKLAPGDDSSSAASESDNQGQLILRPYFMDMDVDAENDEDDENDQDFSISDNKLDKCKSSIKDNSLKINGPGVTTRSQSQKNGDMDRQNQLALEKMNGHHSLGNHLPDQLGPTAPELLAKSPSEPTQSDEESSIPPAKRRKTKSPHNKFSSGPSSLRFSAKVGKIVEDSDNALEGADKLSTSDSTSATSSSDPDSDSKSSNSDSGSESKSGAHSYSKGSKNIIERSKKGSHKENHKTIHSSSLGSDSDSDSDTDSDSDSDFDSGSYSETGPKPSSSDSISNPRSNTDTNSDDGSESESLKKQASSNSHVNKGKSPQIRRSPYGLGLNSTKRRNSRKRLSKKLKSLIRSGCLPPGSNRDDLYMWFEKRNADASNSISQLKGSETINKTQDLAEIEARKQCILDSIASHSPHSGLNTEELPLTESPLDAILEAPNPSPAKPKFNLLMSSKFISSLSKDSAESSQPLNESCRPRTKLDLNSTRRMVFGSLGLKFPKTKEHEDALREQLTEQGKSNPKKPSMANEPSNKEPSQENEDDSWRDQVTVRAIECCEEGVVLSAPPFPFVQRWESNKQGSHRYPYSNRGKKRKRNRPSNKDNVVGSFAGNAPASNTPHEVLQVNGESVHSGIEDLMEVVEPSASPIPKMTQENGDDDDLPSLPSDITHLPSLSSADTRPGAIIAFKHLIMSAATKWQPLISNHLTASVLVVHDNGHLELKLARRDRTEKAKTFDQETGERTYGKFEMPGDDTYDTDDDSGILELTLGELIEPKLVRAAAPTIIDLFDSQLSTVNDRERIGSHELDVFSDIPSTPAKISIDQDSIAVQPSAQHSEPKFLAPNNLANEEAFDSQLKSKILSSPSVQVANEIAAAQNTSIVGNQAPSKTYKAVHDTSKLLVDSNDSTPKGADTICSPSTETKREISRLIREAGFNSSFSSEFFLQPELGIKNNSPDQPKDPKAGTHAVQNPSMSSLQLSCYGSIPAQITEQRSATDPHPQTSFSRNDPHNWNFDAEGDREEVEKTPLAEEAFNPSPPGSIRSGDHEIESNIHESPPHSPASGFFPDEAGEGDTLKEFEEHITVASAHYPKLPQFTSSLNSQTSDSHTRATLGIQNSPLVDNNFIGLDAIDIEEQHQELLRIENQNTKMKLEPFKIESPFSLSHQPRNTMASPLDGSTSHVKPRASSLLKESATEQITPQLQTQVPSPEVRDVSPDKVTNKSLSACSMESELPSFESIISTARTSFGSVKEEKNLNGVSKPLESKWPYKYGKTAAPFGIPASQPSRPSIREISSQTHRFNASQTSSNSRGSLQTPFSQVPPNSQYYDLTFSSDEDETKAPSNLPSGPGWVNKANGDDSKVSKILSLEKC
ncbi:MAG: hypothetical protein M1829_006390 [Trizodia sp. TS-e1964]|nr:MAG: hypothetical protein M1829_006390 [Trizodia sp. TS-e1964]